jgi:hypothetical protein
MKNTIKILILFVTFLLSISAIEIERESIIDIKWKLKNPNDTTRAIYFKHDNTFWHYSDNGRFGIDSTMLCGWNMSGDRIYLSCGDTAIQSFKIIFCDGNNLTISDKDRKNIQYVK